MSDREDPRTRITRNVRIVPGNQNLNSRPVFHTVSTVSLALKYCLIIYSLISTICIIEGIKILPHFN